VTVLLDALQGLYADDDAGGALRLTDRGIWHATPLAVLAAAVPVIGESDLLAPRGRPTHLLDAGAGDGRLLAALALGLPPGFEGRLLGLECDGSLAVTARERLAALARRGLITNRETRVVEGDFFEPFAYEPLGVAPRDLDLVFNYPDGNEHRLLRWLGENGGPQTRLVILSPDREPALGRPPEWRAEVRPEGDTAALWSLSVVAPAAAGRW